VDDNPGANCVSFPRFEIGYLPPTGAGGQLLAYPLDAVQRVFCPMTIGATRYRSFYQWPGPERVGQMCRSGQGKQTKTATEGSLEVISCCVCGGDG